MQIEQMVELINSELKKDNNISVNKIIDNILKLKQSTVKSQLRKANYKFNAELREYTKIDDITKNILKDNIDIKEVDIEPIKDDIQTYNKDIDINKLSELISITDDLKAIVEEYNKNITIVEVNPIEIRPKAITEVKQKLFKVDVEVLEQWEKFVAEHKEYKVQQLISLALEEFIIKYSE